jgi:hypothetical protein
MLLQPEIHSIGGLLFVSPPAPALTLPTTPIPTTAVTATASLPPAADVPMHKPLVVLFDSTPGREQTARRLAQVGGWRIMAVDTSDAGTTAPAIDGIVSAAQGGSPTSYKPAAFVFEAVHPLRPFAPTAQPCQHVGEGGGSEDNTDDGGNNDNTMNSITSLLTSSNAEYEFTLSWLCNTLFTPLPLSTCHAAAMIHIILRDTHPSSPFSLLPSHNGSKIYNNILHSRYIIASTVTN